MQETDLFLPVKLYLESHGYSVNAEVKDCDVTASKDDELVIVELKTSANMQLLIQATDRLSITESVYVAIPKPNRNSKHWRGIQRVIRGLELGLLLISFGPLGARVARIFDPAPARKRQNKKKRRIIINEIAGRSADYNIGGSTRTKLVTAYRENAILVATALEHLGEMSPKGLKQMGTGPKTSAILTSNHYGWFERVQRGIYVITSQGKVDICQYPELHKNSLDFIRVQMKDHNQSSPESS
ncbi:MAG: DUF2161 family putative PD-(D/E)XK-type phosphodiesterase [Pseudomonadales bacterium]|jgi:hypothetical protein